MTLIVIIIDGKQYCSFDGDLRRWMLEQFFKVANPQLQTSVTELTGVPPAIRTKQLRIFSNSHSEIHDVLALFCYDMVDPTRRRIDDDMHHYQVEQHQKTKG